MPKGTSAFCSAARSGSVAPTAHPYLWISDDLLAQTFRTFAKAHKRYGSNVPGPLEARRRSAKRKATTLAHAPYPCNPNPAIIMQTAAQPRWWKKTTAAAESLSLSLWPGFLGRPHQPPPVPVPLEDFTDHYLSWPLIQEQEFFGNLADIRTHDELVLLLEDMSINPFAQQYGVVERVLRFMVEHNWNKEEIAKLLLDPRTNPVGSSVFSCIFAEESESNLEFESLALDLMTTNVLQKAASLGLMNRSDITAILLFALKQRIPRSLGGPKDMSTFIETFLDALECSPVFDDKEYVYKSLLQELEAGRLLFFHASTPRLIRRIITFGSPNELSLQATSQIINLCVSTIHQTGLEAQLHCLVDYILTLPGELVNLAVYQVTLDQILRKDAIQAILAGDAVGKASSSSEEERCEELFGTAKTGSADTLLLRTLIARTGNIHLPEVTAYKAKPHCQNHTISTQRMVASALARSPTNDDAHIHTSRRATPLELWYAVIAGLGSRRDSQFLLDEESLNDFISQHDDRVGQDNKIILVFWVIMAISVRVDRPLGNLRANASIPTLFRRYSAGCQARHEETLTSVLLFLKSTPLPAKNKLMHRIDALTGGKLGIKHDFWQLVNLHSSLESEGFSLFRDKMTYRRILRYFPVETFKLSSSVNNDLAAFEKTARSIICETKGSVKAILRVLGCNSELRLALRRAASLMTWTGTNWQTTNAAEAKALGDYSYLNIVEMIDTFAWDCAKSEILSNRQALRFSWWLLMYLHMHRAPVLPSGALMAVWHVVACRYQKPSYKAVQLIYSLMEEYLGEAAAQEKLNTLLHGRDMTIRPVRGYDQDQIHAKSLTEKDLEDSAQVYKPFFKSPRQL